MSDRAEVKLTILEAVVKGYYECSFAVHLLSSRKEEIRVLL